MSKIQELQNSRVCNTGEGEGETETTVMDSFWVFLSKQRAESVLEEQPQRPAIPFPDLRVCIVVSCLSCFVMYLSCRPTCHIRAPLQETAADSRVCSSCKEPQVPVPARQH